MSKIQYAVPYTKEPKKDGESQAYKSALLEEDQDPVIVPYSGKDTIDKIFFASSVEYGPGEFLGTRQVVDHDDAGNPVYGPYIYSTYEEIYDRCRHFARGIRHMQLQNTTKGSGTDSNFNLMGMYAKNCEGWVVCDYGCFLTSVALVTLYDTLGAESSEYIIDQCELTTIICTKDHISDLLKIKQNGKVEQFENIICLDEVMADDKTMCKKQGITLHTLDEVIEHGKTSGKDMFIVEPSPQTLATICYTSGTTGNPKGVMLTHGNLVSLVATLEATPIRLLCSDVHLSYLPLAHILERIVMFTMVSVGGKIGFYQGDVQKIVEDLAELKPTIFVSVPRLYNKLYDRIQGITSELKGFKKWAFTKGLNAKMANLNKSGTVKHCLWDKLVFKKMKARLGGRVRICITGSAPISKEVLNFLKVCFCSDIVEGYGQTEITGASNVTFPGDPETGHVGGIVPSLILKLQDVPDMDYFHTDKRDGEVFPRGEVCLKGAGTFLGYFKEPEKTAETLDEDGWVHTGDIGELQQNGALRIIDRKKNIFKLAQGEYIAAEKLELIFVKSPHIAQIFVYGDSLQSFLVAIVVPDKEEVTKAFEFSDYKTFIQSDEFLKIVTDWFGECKKENKLNGLEIPKKIFCSDTEFSVEDGTLTPTFKLVRNEAKKKYYQQIKDMYDGAKLQGE